MAVSWYFHVFYGTEWLSYSYMHAYDIHVVLQSMSKKCYIYMVTSEHEKHAMKKNMPMAYFTIK